MASLMTQAGAGLAFGDLAPRAAVDLDGAVEVLGDLVAPVAEGAFRELHDVALVDERDALALVLDRVADGAVDEPLGAEVADRLEADADLDADVALGRADAFELLLPALRGVLRAEADLLELLGEFCCEEVEDLLRLGRAAGVLDAGVDVLGVLAEDHHVHLLRVLHRRGHAGEVAHRAEADVEVEHLPQGDVERADAAADGRGQRALDADEVLLERVDGVVGEPVVESCLKAFSPAKTSIQAILRLPP